MTMLHPALAPSAPAVTRLQSLGPLDHAARAALDAAIARPIRFPPRRELLSEGREIREPLLLLNGWAARVRQLADGRRQILHLLLPGDLVGLCAHERPLATSTVVALTNVEACAAPDRTVSPDLERIYAISHAIEESCLLAHITRLGRLNAHERIADMLLELLERLERAGLAVRGRYTLPLTQEVLADTLGLTSVHVNRTLQVLRRDDDLSWKGRELIVRDPQALARTIGRMPIRVSAPRPPAG